MDVIQANLTINTISGNYTVCAFIRNTLNMHLFPKTRATLLLLNRIFSQVTIVHYSITSFPKTILFLSRVRTKSNILLLNVNTFDTRETCDAWDIFRTSKIHALTGINGLMQQSTSWLSADAVSLNL